MKSKLYDMVRAPHPRQRSGEAGYTILYAVLVASILVAIVLTLVLFSIKELRIASILRNSAEAFAAADTGTECALFWDNEYKNGLAAGSVFASTTLDVSRLGGGPDAAATCGDTALRTSSWNVAETPSGSGVFVTTFGIGLPPTMGGGCMAVTVTKDTVAGTVGIETDGNAASCIGGALFGVERRIVSTYDLPAVSVLPPIPPGAYRVMITKIVCRDEALLPNWNGWDAGRAIDPGVAPPLILETTADDFINSSADRQAGCRKEPGWEFQWGYVHDPGHDYGVWKEIGYHIGRADGAACYAFDPPPGGDWLDDPGPDVTCNSGSATNEWHDVPSPTDSTGTTYMDIFMPPLTAGSDTYPSTGFLVEWNPPVGETNVKFREMLQSGFVSYSDYYPADQNVTGAEIKTNAGDPKNSAEIYCGDQNYWNETGYDNFDWVRTAVIGSTFYCVALNACEPGLPAVDGSGNPWGSAGYGPAGDPCNYGAGSPPAAPVITQILPSSSVIAPTAPIKIQWGTVSDASRYAIERSFNGAPFQVLNDTLPGGTVEYSDNDAGNNPGTYRYRVRAGNATTWSGYSSVVSLDVTVSNQLPVVSITAPANNAEFTAGDDITLSANATDADDGIDRVTFIGDGTPIGMDAASPYSFLWANVPAGSYSLVARAFDNHTPEASSDSAARNITVHPVPLVTRVDVASPTNYTAPIGGNILVALNWYRVNSSPQYATLRFLKISDGANTYSLNDDGVDTTLWANGSFQELVPITIPNVAPGTYDILTGLSGIDYGTAGWPWTDFSMTTGTGVSEVPYSPAHYKVGSINVVPGAGSGEIFLSDLVPTNDPPPNAWGPYEHDMSNGENAGGDGAPLTIEGTSYAKGLGVHAYSEIHYDIPMGCTNFHAEVGVDDETDIFAQGTVRFFVYDSFGNMLYQSGIRSWDLPAIPVDISVSGLGGIRIIVDNSGDNDNFDHADWGDAKFTGCP